MGVEELLHFKRCGKTYRLVQKRRSLFLGERPQAGVASIAQALAGATSSFDGSARSYPHRKFDEVNPKLFVLAGEAKPAVATAAMRARTLLQRQQLRL
jgi:hypothetical protein